MDFPKITIDKKERQCKKEKRYTIFSIYLKSHCFMKIENSYYKLLRILVKMYYFSLQKEIVWDSNTNNQYLPTKTPSI